MAKDHNDLWKGRKLLNAADGQALESAAAVKEFRDGLPREQAEERAYRDYRGGHHEDARAHHYAGMQAALAVGDHDAAHKHGMMYDLHTRAVGKDPMAGVDSEVQARLEANKAKHYKFKAHKGDSLIVHEMNKSEEALEKGKLLQFPSERVAPSQGDLGSDAKVLGTVDPGRSAAANRPFAPSPHEGMAQDVKQVVARMKQTGAKYASLKKPGARAAFNYQNWTAPIGRYLADNHGQTPLDSRGIHEVAHGFARHFGVPYDDVALALDNFRGRHLGSNEDLGHVSIELGRELNAAGHPPPGAVQKGEAAIGDGTTDVSPGSVSND